MANIKISELNRLTEKENNDVLPIVDVSADETKKIKIEDLLDKNVSLIAVTDTAPAQCSIGDKYFNTTNNLIYTATASNTWSETGEEPIEGIFYVVFNEQSSYAYDGTTLVSVGGGTEDIIISDEEPTTDDWKIWIDSGEVNNLGSEVVDSLSGNETDKSPSVRAVKEDLNTYSTNEVRIGTWIDGKPLYRKVINITSPVKGTTTSASHGVSNMAFGFFENTFIYKSDDGSCRPVMVADSLEPTSTRIITQIAPTGLAYYLGSQFQYFTNLYMIINYTKTTD